MSSQPQSPVPPSSSPPPHPSITNPPAAAAPLTPSDTIPNNDTAAADPEPDPDPDPSSFDPSSLDQDIDMNLAPSPQSPSHPPTSQIPQLDGSASDNNADETNSQGDVKMPVQKDISLREFMEKMDEYSPIIPDAVTSHHLLLAGLPPDSVPQPLSRLLALATQKFIADVAADAYQYSRMRASGNTTTTTSTANVAGAPANPAAAAAGVGGSQQQQSQQQQQQGDGTAKGKAGAHVFGTQRAGYGGGGGGSSGRAVLTMEDLGCAVGEYGVNVKRAEFYR
ncbi:MAG: hypothetical protein Q9219_004828 [cf. Caloplaca sp. 3 TL-2023]